MAKRIIPQKQDNLVALTLVWDTTPEELHQLADDLPKTPIISLTVSTLGQFQVQLMLRYKGYRNT